MNFGEKGMNKIDQEKNMIGIMKVGKFCPILMHKIYDLQNKIIIKMFNFDLTRDSIAISKDIMIHLMSKCAIYHIIWHCMD
jgi:hypothetical protein